MQYKRHLEMKEKIVMDTNQKLTSLQQHYKLLKSQNEDLNDEYLKMKTKQTDNINDLQEKLKNVQHQIDVKNVEIESWKVIGKFTMSEYCFFILNHFNSVFSHLETKQRTKEENRIIR